MSRKKKYPPVWENQIFTIKLYEPIGWFIFKWSKFTIVATTHNVARRKFMKLHPEARILIVSNY